MATTSISEVRICNMALSNIGANSSMESLSENTAESRQCDLWYNFSRRQALAAYDWSFARRRLTLATHGDAPPDGVWGYRYQYPSDCISFRKIQNPSGEEADPVPFEIETDDNQTERTILTDLDDAIGVYTFDLQEVSLFSEFFVVMLSYAISSNIAYALTAKEKVAENMVKRFQAMQRAAPASNANESMRPPPRDADWVRGR